MDKLDANQYRENLIDALNHLKFNQVEDGRDILEMLLTQARHPTVLVNLAAIYMLEERWLLAKPLLIESIQQTPSTDALANLALCDLMLGAPEIAAEHAEQALEIDAAHLKARVIGAKALVQLRSTHAVAFIERGLRDHANDNDLLLQKAINYFHLNQPDDAREVCNELLLLDSENQAARDLMKTLAMQQPSNSAPDLGAETRVHQLNNEAIQLRRKGQPKIALERIVEALDIMPNSPELLANTGQILTDLGQFEFALMHYQQSLALNPDNPDTLNNLGNTLQKLNDIESAKRAYETALQKAPDHLEAITNLATIARLNEDYAEAHRLYDQAIKAGGGSADLFYNQGCLFEAEKNLELALSHYEASLSKDPTHAGSLGGALHANQFFCRWDEVNSLSRKIRQSLEQLDALDHGSDLAPFPLIAAFNDSSVLATANKCFARKQFSASPLAPLEHSTRSNNRYRIGYLSSDFGDHATMRLFGPALVHHDHERFEVHILSHTRGPHDAYIDTLCSQGAELHQVDGLTDMEAAKYIQSLELDVLIDLKSFTQNNRFGILSLRPCDKQVAFLGYPAPVNSHAIDYVIADSVVLPTSDQKFYQEKILHLPGCYQPNPRISEASRYESVESERQKWGLPADQVVFASFNQQYKVTEEVADTWLTILKLIPNSVLWFFTSEAVAHQNFVTKATAYGIGGERIIQAEKCDHSEHLQRIHLADICLDTFPCNGHTTTSDCLRHSVPVITVRGTTFAGRVSESLLTMLNLQELVADTPLQYIQLAERLIHDEAFSQSVRKKLDPKVLSTNEAFKPDRFIHRFENLITDLLV